MSVAQRMNHRHVLRMNAPSTVEKVYVVKETVLTFVSVTKMQYFPTVSNPVVNIVENLGAV